MIEPVDPMRVIADGYDRMAASFETWNAARPPDVRRWFLEEVLSRYGAGSDILELGCGPGIEATALAAGRGYVGVDLSQVQIARARQRVPGARFVVGDFLSLSFDADSFDAVVAFYVFDHVPRDEVPNAFARFSRWLRPGGRVMASFPTTEAEDRVEEWLDVPMFFASVGVAAYERALHESGFQVERSEFREEIDPRYGAGGHQWIVARSA